MNEISRELINSLNKYHGDRKQILKEHPRLDYLYALSDQRENLMEWYPFRPESTLLQVGSDYGALTGVYSRKVASVDVLDESPERLAMNTSQYNALMSGIKTAMEIQREAYRIRTIAQEDSYRLAAERLKLERDRLELEKRRSDIGGDDDGVEVRIFMEAEHAEESD